MRTLTFELPEPPSVNDLLRMHHRTRSALRDDLIALVRSQKPRGWKPLRRVRIDAEMRLWHLRDPLEAPAGLKVHVDALHRAGVFMDDSPRHLVVGEIRQVVERKRRGCTITVTEIPSGSASSTPVD